MDFRTYRDRQGWTLTQAAQLLSTKEISFEPSQVRKHELGINIPRPDAIERYRLLTGGETTADDFVEANRRYRSRIAAAAAHEDGEANAA